VQTGGVTVARSQKSKFFAPRCRQNANINNNALVDVDGDETISFAVLAAMTENAVMRKTG